MGHATWHGLELRHLTALRAVADEGSFGRAATQLGLTHGAVGRRIAALERIVGYRLVERPRPGETAELTDAGAVLAASAEAVHAHVRAAEADLAPLSGAGETIRVGAYESVGRRIFPRIVRALGATRPGLRVELRECAGDAELLALVEDGALDLTFTMLPPLEGPFETVPLLSDPYVLLVPSGSPLARNGRPPRLEDIARTPLIGFRSCRNEHRVETHLRAWGLDVRTVFRCDHNRTVQALVGIGLGAALVPRLTVDDGDPRVVALDVDPSFPPRMLGLAWHRDRARRASVDVFVDAARAACAGARSLG